MLDEKLVALRLWSAVASWRTRTVQHERASLRRVAFCGMLMRHAEPQILEARRVVAERQARDRRRTEAAMVLQAVARRCAAGAAIRQRRKAGAARILQAATRGTERRQATRKLERKAIVVQCRWRSLAPVRALRKKRQSAARLIQVAAIRLILFH